MLNDKINITSDLIELSSTSDADDMKAKFAICDFTRNENGIKLDKNNINNWVKTLIGQPLVGKVIKTWQGKEDFSSHNAKIVTKRNDKGQLYKKMELDTSAYGVFEDVWVEGDEIYAEARIWRRFEKVCNIIQAKIDNKEKLATSWELQIKDYDIEICEGKPTRVVKDAKFIGHCLLGSKPDGTKVKGAYESSQLLEVAEDLNEALLQDINILNKNNEGGIRMTLSEIRNQVSDLIYAQENDKISYNGVLVDTENYTAYAQKGDSYIEFKYTVNSDNTVSISSQKDVDMVLTSKSELSELKKRAEESEETKKTLSEKLDDIEKLGETITSQKQEIEGLKKYKEELDKINEEKEVAEKKAKEEKLRTLASKHFSEEELKEEKLTKAISELDENAVKLMIAEKIIEKVDSQKEETEVSEKKEDVHLDVSLSEKFDYTTDDNVNALKKYFEV